MPEIDAVREVFQVRWNSLNLIHRMLSMNVGTWTDADVAAMELAYELAKPLLENGGKYTLPAAKARDPVLVQPQELEQGQQEALARESSRKPGNEAYKAYFTPPPGTEWNIECRRCQFTFPITKGSGAYGCPECGTLHYPRNPTPEQS